MPIHGSVPDSNPVPELSTSRLPLTIREYGDFSPAPVASWTFEHISCLVHATEINSALASARHLNTYFQDRVSAHSPWPEKADDFLYTFWVEFWNIVEQIPQDHSGQKNLAEFVRCLRDMPLAPLEVQKVDVWGLEKRLWQDLPFFEEIALEEVNTIDADVPEANINFEFERHRWQSLHAFIARLTGSEIVDFSKYALWEFRDVVETRNVAAVAMDFRISVVATWLHYAREQLFLCVSAAKWESWRTRFEAIEGDDGVAVSKSTRDIVKNLLKTMQEGIELKQENDSTEPLS